LYFPIYYVFSSPFLGFTLEIISRILNFEYLVVIFFLCFFFPHELKKSKADQGGWPWAGERRVEAASATAS